MRFRIQKFSFGLLLGLSIQIWPHVAGAQTDGYIYARDIAPSAPDSMPKIGKSNISIWMLPEQAMGNGMSLSREIRQARLPGGVYRRYYHPDSTRLAQELFFGRRRTLDSVKTYYPNGKLLGEYPFRDGVYHGPHREYFVGGGISAIWYYEDGMHHEFKFFSHSGNVVRHCIEYQPNRNNGKRIWDNKEYYPDGRPRWEGRTVNAEKRGLWKYWDRKGNLTTRKERGGRMGMYMVN